MYTRFHFLLINNQKWNWRKIPFNISTSNIWRLIFLHICPNPNVTFLWNLSIFNGLLLVTTLVLIYMFQMTKNVSIFKCFLGPFLHLLLRSVCSNHLPISLCLFFKLIYLLFLLLSCMSFLSILGWRSVAQSCPTRPHGPQRANTLFWVLTP